MCFYKFIVFASLSLALFTTQTSFAITQADVDQALKNYIKQDSTAEKSWNLLNSIGWHIQLQSRSGNDIETVPGTPLSLPGYNSLPDSNCQTLCFSINDSTKKTAKTIIQNLFDTEILKAVDSLESNQAYRLKISSRTQQVAGLMSKAFSWPDNPTDGMGTGFSKYFTREDLTLEELVQSGQLEPDHGYTKVEEALPEGEYIGFYASWKNKTKITPSSAIRSLFEVEHTSGCLIALNSAIHLMLYLTYDSDDIFDAAFSDIKINNSFFRPTKLLPTSSQDYSGISKAKLGRNALIGETGYMEAVLKEKVDNPHYEGENFMIIDISDKAVKDLIKMKTLGHHNFTEEDIDDLFSEAEDDETIDVDAERISYYKGASAEMIRFWVFFGSLKKSLKTSAEQLADILKKGKIPNLKTPNQEETYKNLVSILNRPFFSETVVWGHPSGAMKISEWMLELITFNSKTPYSIFLYDYDFMNTQWSNYKRAHLE